ncbi:hypothetical protein [Streptomyces murinus]|uniref:hypothetical protein n=1 Tax=Streptomyces murinus TaxID=33900 RepID=UPI0038128C72
MLRIGNLITAHQGDPAMTFEEAVASVPADELLGGTPQSLAPPAMGRTMDMDTLYKARQARIWVAHEGASIGAIWSVDRDRILQQTRSNGKDPAVGARSGSCPDQLPTEGCANYRFAWSMWTQLLYHQQTKNVLCSYSPKKLGFFWSLKFGAWREALPFQAPTGRSHYP